MADFIDEYNEKALTDLERDIVSVYRKAIEETEEKAQAFFGRFEEKDKINRAKVASGEWTDADYQQWQSTQLLQKNRLEALVSGYTEMINQYDVQAMSTIFEKEHDIFLNNANYVAYHLENTQGVDFGFDIWDRATVDRLLENDVDLLPERTINIAKNNAWNKRGLQRQIALGILQGESIPNIAKRLQNVTASNRTNAIRNARTAVTSAQNAGRQVRMEEAVDMGLIIKKVWVATIDGRTRDEHRELDGQTVGIEGDFEVNGDKIKYPGDIKAPPSEVWNCRCTVIEKYEGITGSGQQERLESDKYREWKKGVTQ